MTKAIFCDRDGVINVEKNYLHKIEDFEFIKGTFEALFYAQSLRYKIFIITNQSGIGRGYYSIKDFKILTNWMLEQFNQNGILISQVELCPHAPTQECNCRKPKTGMIDSILENFEIDLSQSWLIGDKDSDIQCAINAGIKNTIQVKSGHEFDVAQSKADFVCESIKSLPQIIKN